MPKRTATLAAAALAALAALITAGLVGAAPPFGHGRPAAPAGTGAASDPLDPLTTDEIETTFKVIEGARSLAPGTFFPIVRLDEPAKSAAAWSPGKQFPRRAFADVFDHSANRLYEAIVDLRTRQLVSWAPRVGDEPAVYLSEYGRADALVHSYEPFKQAMRNRGIDPDDVYVDVWAPGDATSSAPQGTRLLRALAFYRGRLPNPYDRPIEGVVVTLDMNHDRVIDFADSGARPVNTSNPGSAPDQRAGLEPLVVKQPGGPSFSVDGRNVVWQGWHFRVDYSPREGIVLDRIGYEQNKVVRPVIYRLALSEIYVPYGLDDPNWTWRTAFDIGEYNLGQFAVAQEKNADVPENAVFFDGALAADTGSGTDSSYGLPHAVAMYERDGGSLWQRTDPTTFERDARFARELVVKSAYFIGNYTYEEEFVFHQDGSIDVHVNATGTTLNQGVASTADGNRNGKTVAPNIAAPNHQHFINFRIDFDVDGLDNRVVEQNIVSAPSASGNAFVAQQTPLLTEQFRDSDGGTSRSWVVESASKVNALGEPTGYALEPGDDGMPRQRPDFPALRRAPFAQHPFWVTRYRDGELYGAGSYPNQGEPGNGLAEYNSGESVDGKDVVVWYTLALTHHPRIEEYPVMPTESLGFRIVPDGFFDSNPALDVPAQTKKGG